MTASRIWTYSIVTILAAVLLVAFILVAIRMGAGIDLPAAPWLAKTSTWLIVSVVSGIGTIIMWQVRTFPGAIRWRVGLLLVTMMSAVIALITWFSSGRTIEPAPVDSGDTVESIPPVDPGGTDALIESIGLGFVGEWSTWLAISIVLTLLGFTLRISGASTKAQAWIAFVTALTAIVTVLIAVNTDSVVVAVTEFVNAWTWADTAITFVAIATGFGFWAMRNDDPVWSKRLGYAFGIAMVLIVVRLLLILGLESLFGNTEVGRFFQITADKRETWLRLANDSEKPLNYIFTKAIDWKAVGTILSVFALFVIGLWAVKLSKMLKIIVGTPAAIITFAMMYWLAWGVVPQDFKDAVEDVVASIPLVETAEERQIREMEALAAATAAQARREAITLQREREAAAREAARIEALRPTIKSCTLREFKSIDRCYQVTVRADGEAFRITKTTPNHCILRDDRKGSSAVVAGNTVSYFHSAPHRHATTFHVFELAPGQSYTTVNGTITCPVGT